MSDHNNEPLEERDWELLEEMGYEPTDEPASSPVGKYTAAFFIFLGVMIGISFGFLQVADRVDGFKFGQKRERAIMPPDGTPLLQSNVTAWGDMKKLRAEEKTKMHGYAENPEDGTYRIPIEKAMEIVVDRGLPTRAGAEVPKVMK